MNVVAFDTHAQIKQLVQTGVPEAQAEAFVNIVAGATILPDVSQMATKADVTLLASDIRGEIKAVEANLKGDIKGLQGKLDGIEGRLVWWILGAVGVAAAVPQIVAHLPK